MNITGRRWVPQLSTPRLPNPNNYPPGGAPTGHNSLLCTAGTGSAVSAGDTRAHGSLAHAEYAILPEIPRQLPVFLNRSSLDGGGMRGADCQLEKLTEFSGNDSTMVVECSHDEWVMTN